MSERKVTTDAFETLGTILDADQKRDAIHLAVEPVIAGEWLAPGSDITVIKGVAWAKKPYLGIVDPFLPTEVQAGQRFWFVMYPRTVTSLRHVWSHPAFEDEVLPTLHDKAVSENWMRAWALQNMSDDYGAAICAGYTSNVGYHESAASSITPEWWDHWERITGERGSRNTYFSCSC